MSAEIRNVAAPSSPHATASMKANRRRDTNPELRLRSLLHRRGLRFRVDHPIRTPRGLIRPDIVFPKVRVAVFVDGCYWHRCPEHGELPQANRDFWRAKLAKNTQRDALQTTALEAEGWSVIRIWEHVDPAEAAQTVADVVASQTRP